MSYTNQQVADAAVAHKTRANYTQSFSTDNYPNGMGYVRYTGYLSQRLQQILRERAEFITQVIYSYSTPIAWLDDDVWIIPDATYSVTTSSKHMSKIRDISPRYIPNDAGIEEYLRVLNGHAIYSRGYGSKLGTYSPTR